MAAIAACSPVVQVPAVYAALIDELGLKNANRLGIRITVDRAPTHSELADAVRSSRLSVLHFIP